jgi:tyrosine-protein phosphatase SIW14
MGLVSRREIAMGHRNWLLLTGVIPWLLTGFATTSRAEIGAGARVAAATRPADDPTSSEEQAKLAANVSGLPQFYPVAGPLYRSGQPTDDAIRTLGKRGFKTIVNLRTMDWQRSLVIQEGMRAEHIPTSWTQLRDEDVVRFLRIVTDPQYAPILVHCRRGVDRTGAMCAVYRVVVCGWSKEQAIAEMTSFPLDGNSAALVDYIRQMDVSSLCEKAGLPLTPVPPQM